MVKAKITVTIEDVDRDSDFSTFSLTATGFSSEFFTSPTLKVQFENKLEKKLIEYEESSGPDFLTDYAEPVTPSVSVFVEKDHVRIVASMAAMVQGGLNYFSEFLKEQIEQASVNGEFC